MDRENINVNAEVIMEIIGEKKFLEICKMYGGGHVYFPTFSSMVRDRRNREIVSRYNGVNARRLACEYGLSESHVRRIIKENKNGGENYGR